MRVASLRVLYPCGSHACRSFEGIAYLHFGGVSGNELLEGTHGQLNGRPEATMCSGAWLAVCKFMVIILASVGEGC